MKRASMTIGVLAIALAIAAPSTTWAQGGTSPVPKPPAAPQPPPPPPTVKVGEPMPDFELNYLEPGAEGARPQSKTAKLSDYKGKQVVVLAFFPAAFSPG
jgi:hypothetical protein